MRPTFTLRAFFAGFVAGLAGLAACNTPPKEAHDSAAVPPPPAASALASGAPAARAEPAVSATGAVAPAPASASAAAAPGPAAAPGAPAGCSKDSDCRTFSSYCVEAPCACRVLPASAPDPKCLGATRVSCFADPCMKKTASCQAGACVLTVK